MIAADKLIVALDVSSMAEAERFVKLLSPTVRTFKVGKELFTSVGAPVIEMIHAAGARVFLDLKFHDIPNTVGAACEAATHLRVFMLNVHASGGRQMLFQAVKSVAETAAALKITPPLVIGVTVLTSLKEEDLKDIGIRSKVESQVELLAKLSKSCGLDGVVASAHEITAIRNATDEKFLIVTPGVRPVWAGHGDQKRVMTPREAIDKGANFIVVGRPITQAEDPKAAAERILKEIA